MKLVAIVAMDPDRVIGRDGALPWHIPADLAFFKRTTNGHPVVMGRRTFESIGRPLPNRQNIVLTRDPDWSAEGVTVIHSPDELAEVPLTRQRVFIIGGSEIYRIFLPQLDELLVTHVRNRHLGDVRFPAFDHLLPESDVIEAGEEFTIRRHRPASH